MWTNCRSVEWMHPVGKWPSNCVAVCHINLCGHFCAPLFLLRYGRSRIAKRIWAKCIILQFMQVCIETGFCDNKTRRRTSREAVLSSRVKCFSCLSHIMKKKRKTLLVALMLMTRQRPVTCVTDHKTLMKEVFSNMKTWCLTHTLDYFKSGR